MLLRRTAGANQVVEQVQEQPRRIIVRRASAQEILERSKSRTPHAVVADSAVEREQATKRAKAQIEKQLKLISDASDQIDSAHLQLEQAYKIIEAQLRLVNLDSHNDGVYVAALIQQWTKQQRTIDPKRYRAKVSNSAFWGSIEVSVSKAKEFLTDREINDIADVKPGVSTGFKLKVEKIKRK